MDLVRLTESIYVKTKTRLDGNFRLVQRRVLNTPARPCEEAESYSFTKCVLEFVAARVGCYLDWTGSQRLVRYPPCQSLEQVEKYSDLLEVINDYSWVKLTRETGCYGKCHYKEYKFNKVIVILNLNESFTRSAQLREETINWPADYSSAFYLMAEKTSVEGEEELLVFDFEDLLNGIGGALGLFLGWSILYLGKDEII